MINGRKGVFPTNFCEPYIGDGPPTSTDENKDTEQQEAPPKKVNFHS